MWTPLLTEEALLSSLRAIWQSLLQLWFNRTPPSLFLCTLLQRLYSPLLGVRHVRPCQLRVRDLVVAPHSPTTMYQASSGPSIGTGAIPSPSVVALPAYPSAPSSAPTLAPTGVPTVHYGPTYSGNSIPNARQPGTFGIQCAAHP